MHSKLKWLLLPPAIAVLLFLGPLRQPIAASGSQGEAASPSGVAEIDVGEIVSTLIGVLLLGAAGIAAFAHLQRRGRSAGDGPAALRQSLRLSAKQSVHVVEFDERLLLIGDSDGRLTVLARQDEGPAADVERAVVGRGEPDEGAVPRDLVIPRPPQRSGAKAPTAPKRRRLVEDPFKNLLDAARGAGRS